MKTLFRAAVLAAFTLAVHAQIVQFPPAAGGGVTASTVAGLPAASSAAQKLYLVTDGATASDCSTGLGSTYSLCASNGSSWVSVGGGGSSGVTVGTGAPAGTCTAGALYLRSDGTNNIYELYVCSKTNTWALASYGSGVAASRPVNCAAGQTYLATDTGVLTYCATPGSPGTWSGIVAASAALATALDHTPTLCSTGSAPTGIAASGAAAGCAVLATGKPGAYTAVTFSATPTFTATSNTADAWAITLTAAVASSTLSGAATGEVLNFKICQDGTGGRAFSWPTGFSNAATVSPVASACTKQQFVWDGSNAIPSGGATVDSGPLLFASEQSAPGTPPANQVYCWVDSTDHAGLECKANNSANIFKLVLSGVDINSLTGQVIASHFSSPLPKAQGGAGADMSSVTFPSSGVIVTEAGTEGLTNKTINGLTITSSTGTLTIGNGVVVSGPASSGTLATLGNAEAFTGDKTFTGKLIASGASLTRPHRTSTGSPIGRDACATIGETYFQSDATAGSNIFGCTQIGSPGTWTVESGGGGFANPMTTAGDLITGGSSGTPTRFAAASGYLHWTGSAFQYDTPSGSGATIPSTTNVLKGDGAGNGADTGKAAPSGSFVGTTDTQTLSNKTLTDPDLGTSALSNLVTAGATVTAGHLVRKDASVPVRYIHVSGTESIFGVTRSTATVGNTFQLADKGIIGCVTEGTSTSGHYVQAGSTDPSACLDSGQSARSSICSSVNLIGTFQASGTTGQTVNVKVEALLNGIKNCAADISGTVAAANLPTTTIAQKFFGTAAPGSVAGNLPGDIYSDTTNHHVYECNATSGTSAPACTSVATNGWMQMDGAGTAPICDPMDPQNFCLVDNFMPGQGSGSAIAVNVPFGTLNWIMAGGSSSASYVPASLNAGTSTSTAGYPGGVELVTGASTGNVASIRFSSASGFIAPFLNLGASGDFQTLTMENSIVIDPTGSGGNTGTPQAITTATGGYLMGMHSASVSLPGRNAGSGMGLVADSAGNGQYGCTTGTFDQTAWNLVAGTNGGNVTCVVCAASVQTATPYHLKMVISGNGATITGYVNGVACTGGTITTNIPTTAQNVNLMPVSRGAVTKSWERWFALYGRLVNAR